MTRIRWFDRDDGSTSLDWPVAAAVLATLFLDFYFWLYQEYVTDLGPFYPLPVYAVLLAGISLVITGLFFVGPMLLGHRLERPLVGIIESSVGYIPALIVRFCGGLFLINWMAGYVTYFHSWWWRLLQRPSTSMQNVVAATVLLIFLVATSLHSLRTQAKLAVFTIQLGGAILMAALLRVQDGWMAIPAGLPMPRGRSWTSEMWSGLSALAWYSAPLAVLAADLGHRCCGRKQAVTAGLMGVALPLFGSLLMIGVIGAAVCNSALHYSSPDRQIEMALWSQAAAAALPSRMMITSITLFGAIRFGIRSFARIAAIPAPLTRRGWILLGCLVISVACLSTRPSTLEGVYQYSTQCLLLTAAVLTGDFLVRRPAPERRRRIDWTGSLALLAGLAAPHVYLFWAPELTPYPQPFGLVLPTYFTALATSVSLRAIERLWTLPRR